MKRIFFGGLLSCAVLLLSACPDTKLPNPIPKVPEPKAANAALPTVGKIYRQTDAITRWLMTAAHRV